MTQADAAFEIGLSFRYYAEIERGLRNPTLAIMLAIAKTFRVRVADLVDVEAGAPTNLATVDASPPPTGRKPSASAKRRRSA